jgi:hypothetical protein
MITDMINREINEMKTLRRLELAEKNQAQQAATDAKYHNTVQQVRKCVDAVCYAEDHLDCSMLGTLRLDLISLLVKLKAVVKDGNADKDELSAAESDFKTIQQNVKREWNKHYPSYTSTVINTLRVISGIDPEKTSSCMAGIKAAEAWTAEKNTLSGLRMAMANANSIIQGLNIGAEVLGFLTTMAAGNATIAHLNEEVIAWIRAEALERRIRLSFTTR